MSFKVLCLDKDLLPAQVVKMPVLPTCSSQELGIVNQMFRNQTQSLH